MNSDNAPNEGISIEEAKVLAENVIREKVGWKDVSTEGKRAVDAYQITIWREPKAPGGFRVVSVDLEGGIISIESGK